MEQTSENLSFKVKKTVELSDEEVDQLVDLIRSTINATKTRQKALKINIYSTHLVFHFMR